MSCPAAYFGRFDAERTWEDPSHARLPVLPSPVPDDGIAAMDELLVSLCSAGDVALMQRPLIKEHAEHLLSTGLLAAVDVLEISTSLTRIAASHRLLPWAVTPATLELSAMVERPSKLPSLAAVRRVNSKLWSTELRQKLGLPGDGIIVYSAAELAVAGARLLASSSAGVVLKEPYGVSGRGSLLVTTAQRLARLVAALVREEQHGRAVSLVLEPFVHKRFDFSAQLSIAPDSEVTLDSMQGMVNCGFAYAASRRLSAAEAHVLQQHSCESAALAIASAVAAEGYFGFLGIDGMGLADGSVIPLVEINARGSLGAINARLDRRCAGRGLRSHLAMIRLLSDRPIAFAAVLARLQAAKVLADAGQPTGVVLLTARTLPFGGEGNSEDNGPRAGRLFVSIINQQPGEVDSYLTRAATELEAVGFRLMGLPI